MKEAGNPKLVPEVYFSLRFSTTELSAKKYFLLLGSFSILSIFSFGIVFSRLQWLLGRRPGKKLACVSWDWRTTSPFHREGLTGTKLHVTETQINQDTPKPYKDSRKQGNYNFMLQLHLLCRKKKIHDSIHDKETPQRCSLFFHILFLRQKF